MSREDNSFECRSTLDSLNCWFKLLKKYIGCSGWQTKGWDPLQHCPTLSPFVTCGDKRFKYRDGHQFINGFLFIITLYIPHFWTEVATRIIWLDTTALQDREFLKSIFGVIQIIRDTRRSSKCHTNFMIPEIWEFKPTN